MELNNRLENQGIKNINFTQTYGLDFSAKLFNSWSLSAGYILSINQYTSGALSNKFINHRPNLGTTFLLKGLRLESTYIYNRYDNPNQNISSSFDILDITLSYRKKKSPWEFKIQGLNLLDTREVRSDSFSNNLISTYSYFIQKRYAIFSVMFDL